MAAVAIVCAMARPARAQDADAKLAEAMAHFSEANFERAIELLHEAEALADRPEQLAQINRVLGILQDAVGERIDALVRFTRALTIDPATGLDPQEVRAATIRLFECARRLASVGMSEADIRNLMGNTLSHTDWVCPVTAQPSSAPLPQLNADPPPTPAPGGPALETAAPEPPDNPAMAGWRWGFIVAGGAVAAGGLAVDLALPTADDYKLEPVDFIGLSMMVVGLVAVATGVFFNPYADVEQTAAVDDEGLAPLSP